MLLITKGLDCGKGWEYLHSKETETVCIKYDEFLF